MDRKARLAFIVDRDGAQCVWCRRSIDTDLVAATTEHLVPRVKGGPSWLENEVAACRRCNGERGHRTPAEWIDECQRRGWEPSIATVIAVFSDFQAKVARDGGARRARPYVESQLRRLRRMLD
ncbi:HNH endonuclease [Candidatus Nanopelagicales bacterium]|nr:HNH endonuclease [Candidatus Nanopelagicales bacterium]